MKKLKLTKLIASTLIVASVLALNPVGASAEWKYNSTNWYSEDGSTTGWWYSEGSSWVTGWKYIDGKWYYFNSNGYMNINKTVDGYKLGSDGAWVTTSTTTTSVTNESDFEFDAKTGTITKYVGNNFEVVIPSTIDGIAVTSIGEFAFVNFKNITSVVIPESVKNIGIYAFDGCIGLKSVTMPRGISIGPYAFGSYTNSGGFVKHTEGYCKDAKFYIKGDTVKRFSGFEIDKDTGTIKSYDGSATDVVIPNEIDGVTVKSLGERLFAGGSLTSVTIPNSVISIGEAAFYGCIGLKSVTIPNNVTSIGDSTFAGCSGLTSITIPNSVTSIGYNEFAGCSSLTSVTIPDSVTNIGVGTGGISLYGIGKVKYYVNNEKTKQLLINGGIVEGNIILNRQLSTVAPSNESNQAVTGKSNDKITADENSTGKVKGDTSTSIVPPSNTSNQAVTGKSNDKDDEIMTDESDREITEDKNTTDKVTSIKLNKTSVNIVKGKMEKLKAEVSPSTTTNYKLIWTSSNTEVAIVDYVSGNVVARGKGTATITCTAWISWDAAKDGGNKSTTCEVTVTE